MDGPTQDLPLIEVALGGNLHHQGALKQLQWTSPATSVPISQHSMPIRKLPSVALGALPSTRAEDPLSLEGMDSAVPDLMAPLHRLPQVSLCQNTSPVPFRSVTHPSHLPCQKLWTWPVSPPVHSLKPHRDNPTDLPNEVF